MSAAKICLWRVVERVLLKDAAIAPIAEAAQPGNHPGEILDAHLDLDLSATRLAEGHSPIIVRRLSPVAPFSVAKDVFRPA